MNERAMDLSVRIHLDLPDEAETVPLCRRVLCTVLNEMGVEPERVDAVELVVSEATGNAVRHAYDHPGHRYQFTVELRADRVCVTVEDQGRGFLRSMIDAPELEQPGGRGLWLMEQLADTLTFATLPGGGCRLAAEFLCPASFSPADRPADRSVDSLIQ